MAEEESNSLEYTPTWVVAVVCFVIVLLSLLAERGLHKMGKFLMRQDNKQEALYEALQKLKEELMLLGFISLLLTVFQGTISRLCIPPHLATKMLPCKRETTHGTTEHEMLLGHKGRHLLSSSAGATHCTKEGKVPMLSLEALHQLHIFIFVMAIVHVIFCVTTLLLGGARIRQWKKWEDKARQPSQSKDKPEAEHHHHRFLEKHAKGFWRKAAVISWLISFFKQFYHSITKSDYIALRQGFIMTHFPNMPDYDFHTHMMQTVEKDIKMIVGISWYLWLFVVIFLLLNVEGWHTYFWLAFLPLILLLLVGAKLEHIIKRLALEVADKRTSGEEIAQVEPSDKHFWFHYPPLVLHLIHFILFQNAFEIAFFFWIWSTYGFGSCIMEKLDYIVPRLVMGVIVQVLCSYSTLPLYALVSQMGSGFKLDPELHKRLIEWRGGRSRTDKLAVDSFRSAQHEMVVIDGCEATAAELSSVNRTPPLPSQLST